MPKTEKQNPTTALAGGELGKAFEEALPALRSFARGLCGNRDLADDLVQSACQRGLERIGQLTNSSGLRSWLYRLLYTRYQDLLRDRQRRLSRLYDFSQYLAENARDKGCREDSAVISRIDLRRGLRLLSPEHRAVLILVSMQGYSYQEVSTMLDLPVGTVASRAARARTMLMQCLQEKGRAGSFEAVTDKRGSKNERN